MADNGRGWLAQRQKLEEGMKINIDITKYEAEQTADVNVKLGHDYSIAPNYSFKAPLSSA